MQRFKKIKKPRQPSQQPATFGIPTHIAAGPLGFGVTLDLDIHPEGVLFLIEIQRQTDSTAVAGVNNEGGSRIELLDRGDENQRIHVSGTSAHTPEREDGTPGERALHYSCQS